MEATKQNLVDIYLKEDGETHTRWDWWVLRPLVRLVLLVTITEEAMTRPPPNPRKKRFENKQR